MLVSIEMAKVQKGVLDYAGASCKINAHGDRIFLIDVSEFARD